MPGLPLCTATSSAIILPGDQGSAPGSPARATPASAAASASASPASCRREGGPRGFEQDLRVCYRGRRPGDRFERHCRRRRGDAVESSVVTSGIHSRFSCASRYRPPHQRHRQGDHHCSGASLRAPSSARVSASAARLRRQRAARRPSSSSSAARSTPAHSVFYRRRASVRASSQRQQVLLVTF